VKRLIGIRPRIKITADGEASPTQVCISLSPTENSILKLEDEQEELDFVLQKLQEGDVVVMIMGGSGNNFAFALSVQGESVGAKVYRTTSINLKEIRPDEKRNKDEDAFLLTQLFRSNPGCFFLVEAPDRDFIILQNLFRLRMDTMKARIGVEQRLHQRLIGRIFCQEEGKFPQGKITEYFQEVKASDAVLKNISEEEKEIDKRLERAIKKIPAYQAVFKQVKGTGPAIAARIMTGIGDVRRFPTDAKFRKFCGLAVDGKGRFPVRRRGQVCSWNGDVRQGLYLLADQFVRQKDSTEWGRIFLENKVYLRQRQPDILIREDIVVNGELVEQIFTKKETGEEVERKTIVSDWKNLGKIPKSTQRSVYSDGHIHKMAIWRTITQYVNWLYAEWTHFEVQRSGQKNFQAGDKTA
jgi:hypothetical protein